MWGLLIVGTGPAGVSAALTARAQIPALIQSGWFDDNGMGTTEALELVHNFPRGMRKVILGPWQHSDNSKYDMHGVSFGSQALRFDLDWLYFRWFEHHLKEVDNGIDQTAPVEYYTLPVPLHGSADTGIAELAPISFPRPPAGLSIRWQYRKTACRPTNAAERTGAEASAAAPVSSLGSSGSRKSPASVPCLQYPVRWPTA